MYFEKILQVLSEREHEITEKMTEDDFWFDSIVDEYMPDHNSGASWYPSDIQNLQYSFDEAKYYGYGLIILPATFTLDMNLSYFIEKEEYMKDPASTRLKTMQMIRDDRAVEGYYDIEEVFPLQAKGDVFINLRLDTFSHLEDIDLQGLIRNAEIRLDSIHRTMIDYTQYEGRVYIK